LKLHFEANTREGKKITNIFLKIADSINPLLSGFVTRLSMLKDYLRACKQHSAEFAQEWQQMHGNGRSFDTLSLLPFRSAVHAPDTLHLPFRCDKRLLSF